MSVLAAPQRGERLLEATDVTRRFGGVTALHEVTMHVDVGEIVGLIGPNGAGKTTFFDCVYGSIRPQRGKVTFAGHDLSLQPEHRRARLGLGRTFQRVELFPGMTVTDHHLVAARTHAGNTGVWRDLVGRGRVTTAEREAAGAVLELLGLAKEADRPIEALSLGHGRLVELGRALMIQPRLLLLDEPSSGLDRVETAAMVTVLNDVQRERQTAILLVEHDVEMVAEVTSRSYVLDLGKLIATGPTREVLQDPDVRLAYLGITA
jgi:branched-chain amino acid transport system ATP-binding protein